MFTAQDVVALRARTNAGMMACKEALTEANGDMEKAVDILKEKGAIAAAKRAGRIASEGVVASYIHMGGKIGVLVEVNCETDFVARSDGFNVLVKDIAMQIAASNPLYVAREDVPSEEVEKEKQILKAQAMNEGKPENIAEKMVEGRLNKYFAEICLLEQPFIKDQDKTIKQYIEEATLTIGEKIKVRRFVRYEMGEGLEKKSNDFVSEVMSQTK
jgi:elongation factor Ts